MEQINGEFINQENIFPCFDRLEQIYGNVLKQNEQVLVYVVKQLSMISQLEENEVLFSVIKDYYSKKNIEQGLLILELSVSMSYYYRFFSEYYQFLILEGLLPNFILNKKDEQDFYQQPQEFVNSFQDFVENRQGDDVRIKEAILIKKFCQKICGCSRWLFNFCLDLLEFIIFQKPLNEKQKVLVENLSKNNKFSHGNKVQQVGSILVSIIIMKEEISQREDLVQISKQRLGGILRGLLEQKENNNLINFYILSLLKVYPSGLLLMENQQFQEIINFVLKILQQKEKIQSLELMGIETLLNFIAQKENFTVIQNSLYDLLIPIQNMIQSTQIADLFDFVQNLFEDFGSDLDTYIEVLIKNIVNRINQELYMILQKFQKGNIFIDKCLNILQTITKNQHLMTEESFQVIEENCLYVLEILNRVPEINFEESLIKLFENLLFFADDPKPYIKLLEQSQLKIINANQSFLAPLFTIYYRLAKYFQKQIVYENAAFVKNSIYFFLSQFNSEIFSKLKFQYEYFCQISILISIYLQFFEEILKDDDQFISLVTQNLIQIYLKVVDQVQPIFIYQNLMNLIIIAPVQSLKLMQNNLFLNQFLEQLEKVYFQKFITNKIEKKYLIFTLITLLRSQEIVFFSQIQFTLLLEKLISLVTGENLNQPNNNQNNQLETDETLFSISDNLVQVSLYETYFQEKEKTSQHLSNQLEWPLLSFKTLSILKQLFVTIFNNSSYSEIFKSIHTSQQEFIQNVINQNYQINLSDQETIRKIIKITKNSKTSFEVENN